MIAARSVQRVGDLVEQVLGVAARADVVLGDGELPCSFNWLPRSRRLSEREQALALAQVRHHQIRLQPRRAGKKRLGLGEGPAFEKRLTQRKQGQFILRVVCNQGAQHVEAGIVVGGQGQGHPFAANGPHRAGIQLSCTTATCPYATRSRGRITRTCGRASRREVPLAKRKLAIDRKEWLPLTVIGALALFALGLYALRHGARSRGAEVATPAPRPAAPPPAPTPAQPRPPAPISADELRSAAPGPSGHLVVERDADARPTSLPSALQRDVAQLLASYGLPYGAVVLIDPRSGQVLTMAETRDGADPVGAVGHLTKPTVPAASVIKVVTASALLDAGVGAEQQACFHGGLHGLDASHLRERPGDRRCETLTEALARSSNAAIARFALRDLAPGALAKMASAFGFNRVVPSDIALEPSRFDGTGSDLERARAAAGFSGSTLSPLHAAWIAALVASDGKLRRISAWDVPLAGIDRVEDHGDAPTIAPEVAATLRHMMVATTEFGTGRAAFSRRAKVLRGIAVGGKTGSLSAPEGDLFRHVSWFVGFAPAERPRVAIAALAVNGLRWKVKAPAIARDALGLFFERAGEQTAATALDVSGHRL